MTKNLLLTSLIYLLSLQIGYSKASTSTVIYAKEVVKAIVDQQFIVTAENGVIIREKPSTDSNRIGKVPYGSSVIVVEITDQTLIIEDKDKQLKGNWIKVKTYNYPYSYSKTSAHGYVFGSFLKEKKTFVKALQQTLKKYPKFANFTIDSASHPFVIKGDFFGDGVKDLVLKFRNSSTTQLGFINFLADGQKEAVLIETDNSSSNLVDFGWTEKFALVTGDTNLWPSDEDSKNIHFDFNFPKNKKLVLGYDALYGHILEGCGGGYIFWYKGKFHQITGD